LYDAAVATGKIREGEVFDGELAFSHVKIEIESAKSMREFVNNAKKAQETFFKESGV
jgi:pyocin large subunit-like protein